MLFYLTGDFECRTLMSNMLDYVCNRHNLFKKKFLKKLMKKTEFKKIKIIGFSTRT